MYLFKYYNFTKFYAIVEKYLIAEKLFVSIINRPVESPPFTKTGSFKPSIQTQTKCLMIIIPILLLLTIRV